MLGGIFIKNVDVIFNFVGAIAGAALSFIFPACFYIVLSNREEAKHIVKRLKYRTYIKISAWFYAIFGISAGTLLFAINIWNIIDPITTD